MGRQRKLEPRRIPRQTRAKETIEFILDGAERVLETEGTAGFTTTKVAQAAGFGVGTLYQYFGTKEELLSALEERTWARVTDALLARMADADVASPADLLRSVLGDSITTLSRWMRFHGVTLFENVAEPHKSARVELEMRATKALEEAFTRWQPILRTPDVSLAANVVVNTVVSQARIGTMYHPERMLDGSYPTAIVDMLVRYLVNDDALAMDAMKPRIEPDRDSRAA